MTSLGSTEHTAGALLAVPVDGAERGALDEAKDWLRETLLVGPMSVVEIRKQATRQGLSPRTLDRAKSALGIQARKKGFGEGASWVWDEVRQNPEVRQPQSLTSFAENGGSLAYFDESADPSVIQAERKTMGADLRESANASQPERPAPGTTGSERSQHQAAQEEMEFPPTGTHSEPEDPQPRKAGRAPTFPPLKGGMGAGSLGKPSGDPS